MPQYNSPYSAAAEGFNSAFNTGLNYASQQRQLDIAQQQADTAKDIGLRQVSNDEARVKNETERLGIEKTQIQNQANYYSMLAKKAEADKRLTEEQITGARLDNKSKNLALKYGEKDAAVKDYNQDVANQMTFALQNANRIDELANKYHGGNIESVFSDPRTSREATTALQTFWAHPSMTSIVRQEAAQHGVNLPADQGAYAYTMRPSSPGMLRVVATSEKGGKYDLGEFSVNDIVAETRGFARQASEMQNLSDATGVTSTDMLTRLNAQNKMNGRHDMATIDASRNAATASQPQLQSTAINNWVNQFIDTDPNYFEDYRMLKEGNAGNGADNIKQNLTKYTSQLTSNSSYMRKMHDAGLISTADPNLLSSDDWEIITLGTLDIFKNHGPGMKNINPFADGLQKNELAQMQAVKERGFIDQHNMPITSNLREGAKLLFGNLGRSGVRDDLGYSGSAAKQTNLDQLQQMQESGKQIEQQDAGLRKARSR